MNGIPARKSKAEVERSVMAILLDEDTNATPIAPMSLPMLGVPI